jgi:hypothetical protein
LHLGVDESSGEIVAAAATTFDFSDGQRLPDLLVQMDAPIAQLSAGGAYDTRECHAAIHKRKAQAAILPRCGARICQHGKSNASPRAAR